MMLCSASNGKRPFYLPKGVLKFFNFCTTKLSLSVVNSDVCHALQWLNVYQYHTCPEGHTNASEAVEYFFWGKVKFVYVKHTFSMYPSHILGAGSLYPSPHHHPPPPPPHPQPPSISDAYDVYCERVRLKKTSLSEKSMATRLAAGKD